ncbi:MAG: DNA polymerase IV [Puniceicoccales bacterium]|jgi:DNA polymerase-4|nr:DNA polymerase IV [Puniceicoccales bacterium]
MPRASPTFVHLDADAFFVGVECALNPALRGKKVAVGGGTRGIIASASYEARACGVHTPMPTAQALRICPDLVLVGGGETHCGGMPRYIEFSRKLFDLCAEVTPLVERRSIDEGFMDLGPCGFADTAAIEAAMRGLQQRIADKIGLSVSFGLAANKLLSAISSKRNKPHGFTIVPPGTEEEFLAPLPVGVLPGVGPRTESLLKSNGIVRVGDIPRQPESLLAHILGNAWREFRDMARGVDESQLSLEHREAKSYSQQETFPRDIRDFSEILRITKRMIDELLPQIRADGKRARTLTVKVRYPGMHDDVAGHSLPEAADLEDAFYGLAETLLRQAWRRTRSPLRLVMVRFSGIETPSAQLELFPEKAGDLERKRRLASVVDALNQGIPRIMRGHGIGKPGSPRPEPGAPAPKITPPPKTP